MTAACKNSFYSNIYYSKRSKHLKTYDVIQRTANSDIHAEDILFATEPIQTQYHGMQRIIFARNNGGY